MKMKKNGFNLIELLFVMVLVAVVAIIGYYAVMNSLQKAKKNSFVTDCKTVFRESEKMYSTQSMLNNKLSVISTDDGDMDLGLSNADMDYCVNLDDKGKITNIKVTNGVYFLESKNLEGIESKVVKYGKFDNFSCDYELQESDLLVEEDFSINIKDQYMKYIKIIGGIFVGIIVLSLMFRSKINR